MKKKIITLITTLSMLCFVACGSATGEMTKVGTGSGATANTENAAVPPTEKPVEEATATPTEEPRFEVIEATTEPTPTDEPVAEVTPEPTEEPVVVYEGIDMNSDLSGTQWIKTFIGVISEPKVVVYSDETGKKEIVEKDAVVMIDPASDTIAVYLPEGYIYSRYTGIQDTEQLVAEHYRVFLLNAEETKEAGPQLAIVYVKYEGEEIGLQFALVPEE